MSDPVFLKTTPDLHGSIIAGPSGQFIVSAFHEPSGRTIFGLEDTYELAMSWLEDARLIFAEPDGSA